MKTLKFLFFIALSSLIFSCVSSKKYASMNANYEKAIANQKSCELKYDNLQSANNDLMNQNKDLASQVEYLKKNSSQVLNTLQDMSILSGKQAESMKQSLLNLSEKDAYIKNLNSAIMRKDSLNMNLVMNLKSSLADINDQDINIKVEKGVVFVDISDKLLFNSGQYSVSEKANNVLEKIATVLNSHPELDVMVEGHTDSISIHTAVLNDNWDLSVKRATSVVRILQNKYGIDPRRITAAGHGKYDPVSTNTTSDGRALNRRTRIIILPQLDQFFKLLVKDKA